MDAEEAFSKRQTKHYETEFTCKWTPFQERNSATTGDKPFEYDQCCLRQLSQANSFPIPPNDLGLFAIPASSLHEQSRHWMDNGCCCCCCWYWSLCPSVRPFVHWPQTNLPDPWKSSQTRRGCRFDSRIVNPTPIHRLFISLPISTPSMGLNTGN